LSDKGSLGSHDTLYEFNVFTKTPRQIYDKHLHRLNILDCNNKYILDCNNK